MAAATPNDLVRLKSEHPELAAELTTTGAPSRRLTFHGESDDAAH